MAYNQIYSIVNAATKQTLGDTAVAVIDASTMAEVGGQIVDSSNPATLAAFVYGLSGAINETRIKAKSYDTGAKISMLISFFNFNFYYYYYFLLYNIVLVLPYINMHLPWVSKI